MTSHPNGRVPRILYVSEILPSNAGFGGELRCLNLLKALQQVGSVELVLLDDDGVERQSNGGAGSQCGILHRFPVKERPVQNVYGKVIRILDPRSDYPHGCGVDAEALKSTLRSLDGFDLVWFFKLRAADMFPDTVWPRSVVDIDDLPTTYMRSAQRTASGGVDRISAYGQLFKWERRQKMLAERFNVLAVCSEDDKHTLRKSGVVGPIHVIPNGFDRPRVEPTRCPATPPRVGFIGLLEYFPNLDGINWFIREVWPFVKREVPLARLRLVGSGGERVDTSAADIEVTGWLEDTSAELKTWSVMVVPLRLGAGTRVKIAHAMSQKCPVVSTAFGAFGYDVMDGREMYIADSPQEFARACIRAIAHPDEAAKRAETAWKRFLEQWTWDSIAPLVWRAAEDCLKARGRARTEGETR